MFRRVCFPSCIFDSPAATLLPSLTDSCCGPWTSPSWSGLFGTPPFDPNTSSDSSLARAEPLRTASPPLLAAVRPQSTGRAVDPLEQWPGCDHHSRGHSCARYLRMAGPLLLAAQGALAASCVTCRASNAGRRGRVPPASRRQRPSGQPPLAAERRVQDDGLLPLPQRSQGELVHCWAPLG